MLVKRFVPKALMQQNQKNTPLDDGLEVVEQFGYFLLNPTFKSIVANVSTERAFWRNILFYHSKEMSLKERLIADKLTVAIQEALINGNVYDVRGFGTKVMYSPLYGTSFQWIDIPEVRVKCKNFPNGDFDFTSCLLVKPTSSQLTKLQGHNYYLDEFNQALTSDKTAKFMLLAPSLVNGWLKYPLLDIEANTRLDFTNYEKMQRSLKDFTGGLPLMKNFVLSKMAHMLITARTGLGKSFLAFALSAELGSTGNKYIQYYLDPKHSDLSNFGRFLGSRRYADTIEGIDTKLEELVKLMQKRYAIMRKMADKHPRRYVGASADQFGFKPIVIFFDEVSAYLASSKKGINYLKKLLMLGRQASIFCVLILQDPRATNNLPSTIKDQAGIRIALGELNGTLAGLVFGSGIVLPDVPRGIGKGYIQVNGGEVQLFDAPMMPTDSANLYELMKRCLAGQTILDPLQHN